MTLAMGAQLHSEGAEGNGWRAAVTGDVLARPAFLDNEIGLSDPAFIGDFAVIWQEVVKGRNPIAVRQRGFGLSPCGVQAVLGGTSNSRFAHPKGDIFVDRIDEPFLRYPPEGSYFHLVLQTGSPASSLQDSAGHEEAPLQQASRTSYTQERVA